MEEGLGSVWFLWGPRSKSLPQVDASGITIPLQPNFKLGLARVPPSPVHNHTFFREFSGVYKNYFISWKLSYALCSCFNLYSGSTKPLSSCDLKAVTNDDSTGNRTVTFTVVSSPRLGRLLRMNSDNSTEDVSIFTQYLVSLDICVVEQS
jgi:hypothetical protein